MGAVLRYIAHTWTHRIFKTDHFPIGTVIVNILGCFAIGLLTGWTVNQPNLNPHVKLLLFVGFLGGFTTFSTFSMDTLHLIQNGKITHGLANIACSLVLGLFCVWLGYGLSHSG